MRKNSFIPLVVLILVLCGCNIEDGKVYRTVTVQIPRHPWEKVCDAGLWYYLCWNEDNGIEKLFVDSTKRSVELRIPTGCTVIICAYPLGEMLPFGCAVTPLNSGDVFEMDQDQGYIADLVLNTEADSPGVAERVNWNKLVERAALVATDWRQIDDQRLVKDVLNGELTSNSIKTREMVTVPSFAVSSGTWISESVHDGRYIFAGNESGEMKLPVGITRFLNPEKNLELRVVVDESGSVFQYERQALVSSLNQSKGLKSEAWNL